MKFCQYVWIHARFVKIYFDSSGSTVQVRSRSKKRQKMTNLNFENKLYLTGTCAIWHRWLWCAPTCALSNETPLDPVWCGISELWSKNHMSDCLKMRIKKSKSAKRAFLGRFLTFWVNLIRRIWILQKFWLLDNVYPRYGRSKFENDQKSEKTDQKLKFDFFMFLGNSTMKNTNFNSVLMIILIKKVNIIVLSNFI